MTKRIAFLDTNTFLHYRAIEEVDWLTILGAGHVSLVIVPIVIRELNKHKDYPKAGKARERASATLIKLSKWAEEIQPVEIRSSVELNFLALDPTIPFSEHSLSRDVSDDFLIASVIQHRSEHSSDLHVIVTADLGLKLKAKAFGLQVLQLAESLKLPDELLPDERRTKELESQVRRLQNRLPLLKLLFGDGGTRHEVTLEAYEVLTTGKLDNLIADLREKNPRMEIPDPKPTETPAAENGVMAFLLGLDLGVPVKEIKEYNDKLETYFKACRKYLKARDNYLESLSRTVPIALVITNDGTCPADDVDVFAHFPDGFTLLSESELPEEPSEPKLPRRPLSRQETVGSAFSSIVNPSYISYGSPNLLDFQNFKSSPRNVGHPSIKKTKSYDVEIDIGKIKHGIPESLDTIYAVFESVNDARSFTIDYRLHATNLPDPVSGQLHLIIRKPIVR
jgi:hypothetical protein